jgi:indole-3-glycerol phosphate synthase
MDWRRLEAARAAAPRVAASELRPSIRDFTQYLGAGRRAVGVIPLLRRRNPETGGELPRVDVAAFARAADALEIPALAIATTPGDFALDALTAVAAATSAPVLRYDCVASEDRLYESRLAGADAVLVPVAIAGDALPRLVTLACAVHVVAVAEVTTAAECAAAIHAGAPVLALGPGCSALAAEIPSRYPVLAHDGSVAGDRVASDSMVSPAELARFLGVADAVLVGDAILAAADPLARLEALADAAAALSR